MIVYMKTLFVAITLITACLNTALAIDVDSIRADMAVPGSPAFILMDMNQSAIMRPSNAREIAISIGNIMFGGTTLPQTFGVELSPGMMLMKKSLHEYQTNAKKRFLYRMNLSGGITRAGSGIADIAFGTRFTLIDETDLLTDTSYTRLLIKIGQEKNNELTKFIEKFIPAEYCFMEAQEKESYDSLMTNYLAYLTVKYNDIIEEKRDSVKQNKWNNTILEIGLAGMGTAPDSITRHLIATKYGLWTTYGFSIGENNLNLLGLRLLTIRNIDETFKQVNGTIVLRSYVGEVKYKGYLEGDGSYTNNDTPSYALSLGGEMNIGNGIWLEVSTGVRKQVDNGAEVISLFNLKLATTEVK